MKTVTVFDVMVEKMEENFKIVISTLVSRHALPSSKMVNTNRNVCGVSFKD